MPEPRISVRVEPELFDDVAAEAKKRKVTVAVLVRSFLLDGLSKYDAMGEALLQSNQRIEKLMGVIQQLSGIHLHHSLEDWSRQQAKDAGESEQAYVERITLLYRQRLEKMRRGGERVIEVIEGKNK